MLLHIQLKKIHRYGDWLKRPLGQDLINYAYEDAATIYKLHPIVQKKLKDVNEEKESKGPTTVNNSLFVGSTAELQKFLKQNDKQ